MAEQLGRRYGQSQQIMAWQIDNEIGHPFCHCDHCRESFQRWLRDRWQTVEKFNEAHVTGFWGMSVERFDQVPMPDQYRSPSLDMAYHQWHSQVTIDCFSKQIDALRQVPVCQPITTNMMITWYGYDHEKLAERLDVIAGDHYPMGNTFGDDFAGQAFNSGYLRGLKPDRNIWYHETQCGLTGAGLPLPGELRWWTLVNVGLGVDAMNFFRFDTAPSGTERGGYGLLHTCRQPGRVFDEMKRTSAELEVLRPLLAGSKPMPAEVGVLFTFDNHHSFARRAEHAAFAGPSGNGYSLHLAKHLRAIAGQSIPVDLVYPGDDFSRYRCLLVPALYVATPELAEKLAGYVRGGGVALVTCFSGVIDTQGRMFDTPIPGPLRELVGVRVLDRGPYRSAMGDLRLAAKCGKDVGLPVRSWVDEVLPDEGTDVVARYAGPVLNEVPALTVRKLGDGIACYLGTILTEADYRVFYRCFLGNHCGVQPLVPLPDGVCVSCRAGKAGKLYFFSNETDEPKTVSLPAGLVDALTGEALGAKLALPAHDVRVLKA